MTIKSKLFTAWDMAAMTTAVSLNTGNIPRNHRCLVTIEPTSVCNLSCTLCPVGTPSLKRKNKFISLEYFDRILKVTKPFASGYVLNMFGEPVFHPQLDALLEKTRHLPTWLSTNLSYDEKYLRELARWEHLHVICSVDTLQEQKYADYRVGGDYATVIENLRTLATGRCTVHPQFLVSEDKLDDGELRIFAERVGVPFKDMIIKTKLDDITLEATDKPVKGRCHSSYFSVYFNCDGYMVPCCANAKPDLYVEHIDNINNAGEILRGLKARKQRKILAKDKNYFPSCGRCEGVDFWKKQFPWYLRSVKTAILGERGNDQPHSLSFYG